MRRLLLRTYRPDRRDEVTDDELTHIVEEDAAERAALERDALAELMHDEDGTADRG